MKFAFSTSRATLAAALLAIGGFALAQNAPHAANATNARPPTLVIDRHAIMLGSKLGQDIHRQIMAYEDKVQSDLGAQGQALQNEKQAFQQQSPSLPPVARDKKMEALQTREAAYRQQVQARQSLIQGENWWRGNDICQNSRPSWKPSCWNAAPIWSSKNPPSSQALADWISPTP